MKPAPQRVQLRRTKGYKKPVGAVVVSRPSKWGNPFTVAGGWQEALRAVLVFGCNGDLAGRRAAAVKLYELWLNRRAWKPVKNPDELTPWQREVMTVQPDRLPPTRAEIRRELRGKDLACWCPLPKPGEPDVCHAAVLLRIANEGTRA